MRCERRGIPSKRRGGVRSLPSSGQWGERVVGVAATNTSESARGSQTRVGGNPLQFLNGGVEGGVGEAADATASTPCKPSSPGLNRETPSPNKSVQRFTQVSLRERATWVPRGVLDTRLPGSERFGYGRSNVGDPLRRSSPAISRRGGHYFPHSAATPAFPPMSCVKCRADRGPGGREAARGRTIPSCFSARGWVFRLADAEMACNSLHPRKVIILAATSGGVIGKAEPQAETGSDSEDFVPDRLARCRGLRALVLDHSRDRAGRLPCGCGRG